MSEWFHVGQNVVCVNDVWSSVLPRKVAPNRPVAGCAYTVRAVIPDALYIEGLDTGLLLEELLNPLFTNGTGQRVEYPFWAARFRPCRKVDISIFTAMLNAAPRELVTAGGNDTRREGA